MLKIRNVSKIFSDKKQALQVLTKIGLEVREGNSSHYWVRPAAENQRCSI